jgi:Spy/CpxP family protein refolding chaperone
MARLTGRDETNRYNICNTLLTAGRYTALHQATRVQPRCHFATGTEENVMTVPTMHHGSKPRNVTVRRAKSLALSYVTQVLLVGGVLAGAAPAVFAQATTQTQASPHAESHRMMHQQREGAAGDRESRMKRMLANVGATGEQQAKIADIMRQARNNTQATRQKRMEAHKAIMELLAKPTIDRAAIEAQRAEAMRLADAASTIRVKAYADAAEVLTPEQRAKLAAQMQHRHHEHGDEEHHHGMHSESPPKK